MSAHRYIEERGSAFSRTEHNTALLEADQLIRNWVEDVRLASSHDDPHQSNDFLSSVDWCHGDVGASAKVIVQGLMSKNIDVSEPEHTSPTSKAHDPRVAMEMRHMKVRERRAARDKKRAKSRERMSLVNEARQKAEEIVLLEERRSREKREREDKLVTEQMKQVRVQLREKQRAYKLVAMDIPSTTNAVEQAEEFIKNERKRQHTRGELLRQLEQAEAVEIKNKFKVLHTCFSRWFRVVIEGRGKLVKAVAMSEWKLVVRVWSAWRGWVAHCRARREREQTARQMQRQRILLQRACSHERGKVLSKALWGWMALVRQVREAKKEMEVQAVYKRKMDAFLQTATQRLQTLETTDKVEEVSNCEVDSRIQRGEEKQVDPQDEVKPPPPKPVQPTVPQPIIWQRAKQELAQLMADVEAATQHASTTKQPVKSGPEVKRSKSQTTKPIPMSGMESRSRALAQRKASRMERQIEMERKKLEALAKQEEAKACAELEEKRIRHANRRAERQSAKQREMEREDHQRQMAILVSKATHHYRLVQLKTRGLGPWIRFMGAMREAGELANRVRVQILTRRVLHVWRSSSAQRILRREQLAEELWNRFLLRRAIHRWREYMGHCQSMDELATSSHPKIVTRCVFRGWLRVTGEERVKGWELMTKARRFRERHLKQRVLSVWVSFIPLAREERAHEIRRADLRRKVASWLHNYTPNEH